MTTLTHRGRALPGAGPRRVVQCRALLYGPSAEAEPATAAGFEDSGRLVLSASVVLDTTDAGAYTREVIL